MSINTLVLTSIKVILDRTLKDYGHLLGSSINYFLPLSQGTPLYMSPELVEERPYDHNADLW